MSKCLFFKYLLSLSFVHTEVIFTEGLRGSHKPFYVFAFFSQNAAPSVHGDHPHLLAYPGVNFIFKILR
jgi:hypothetical protein